MNPPITRSVIGFDVGQERDPAALCKLDQMHRRADGRTVYMVRKLERALRIDYRSMTVWCKQRVMEWGAYGASIALDYTGCGRPFLTMLLEQQIPCPITPIGITGGARAMPWAEYGCQGWNVPKKELVAIVKLLIQQNRLGIEPGIADAKVLAEELKAFEYSVTDSGNVKFGARSGAHDDVIMGVALALWLGENTPIGWDGGVGIGGPIPRPPTAAFAQQGPADSVQYPMADPYSDKPWFRADGIDKQEPRGGFGRVDPGGGIPGDW